MSVASKKKYKLRWLGLGFGLLFFGVLTASFFAPSVSRVYAAPASGCTTGTDANGNCKASDDNTLTDCSAGDLNWLACPLIKLMQEAAQTVDNFIMDTLDIDVPAIFDSGVGHDGYYTAWNSFRVIGTALLILGGLFMVISQALGFEFFDAYTVKKVLPRLLIAAVGISLSWPLMRFAVSLSNTVGIDIRSLMYAPFANMNANVSAVTGSLISYLMPLGVWVAMGPAALTLLLTAFLALMVGFIILVVRQVALIMLIVLAPIAIACYVLPNTQKVWKLWWDNFLGILLVFPVISALIAAGHIFAVVSFSSGGNNVGSQVGPAQILGIIAYFVPYFLLPLAFRFVTGAVGQLAGMVNDRSRGAFDRLKKFRGGQMQTRAAKAKAGNLYTGSNPLSRGMSSVGQVALNAGDAGFNPAKMRQRYHAAHSNHTFNQAQELREKNHDFMAGAQDDELLRAVARGSNRQQTIAGLRAARPNWDEHQILQAANTVERMNKSGSTEAVRAAAAMQLAATGSGYENSGQMINTLANVSGGDEVLANRMLGSARSLGNASGRHDLGSASFGEMSGQLHNALNGVGVDQERLDLNAFDSVDTMTLARDRNESVTNLSQTASARIAHLDAGRAARDAEVANLQALGGGRTVAQTARMDQLTTEQQELGELVAKFENAREGVSAYGAPQRARSMVVGGEATETNRNRVQSQATAENQQPDSYNVGTRQRNRDTEQTEGYNRVRSNRGMMDPRLRDDP